MDDVDPGIRQFPAQGLGKAAQAGLGGGIGSEAGEGDAAEGRTDIDDGGLRLRLEPGQQSLGQADGGEQIGAQGPFDLFPTLVIEQAKAANAGIVDQHVDVEVPRSPRHSGDPFLAVEIGDDHVRAGPEMLAQGIELAGIAAGEQDFRACPGQRSGQSAAQATAGAGQQDAGVT